MAQVRRIPFRGSATLGRGVNLLTGEIIGKALKVLSKETATSGGEAIYDVQIVESHEALMQSLGLSVEASGSYGLFSAEGKFSLSEKSSFNSQSTFVVASCRVQNAFEMVDQVELLPEAKQLREHSPDQFKTAFGTGFVRGLQTGGEFYAVLRLTSTSNEMQSQLSASFQAECQGLVASGSFKSSLDTAKSHSTSKTELSITMYQRAGQDEQLSLTKDAGEIIQRLKEFPTIARMHPCGYEAEVADYTTLALPAINQEKIFDREMSLQDCARLRLKYATRRNDIEFARDNRDFFEDLPGDPELADLWDAYSRAVTLVQRHAQRIADNTDEPPTVFDLRAADPNLELPAFSFKRRDVPNDIPLPDFTGDALEAAKARLESMNLVYDGDGHSVPKDSGQKTNMVTTQYPPAGTRVQPKTAVRLSYNYVASDRFKWALKTHVDLASIKMHGRAGAAAAIGRPR